MRKFFILLLLILFICCSFSIAGAVPMYYTFEGTVTNIENENGSINPVQVSIGDSVEQVWIVDLETSGYDTFINGTINYYPDNGEFNYFYVDYYSGLNVVLTSPGLYDGAGDVAEINRGYTYQNAHTILAGESANERIWLKNDGTPLISNWSVGTNGFTVYQTLLPQDSGIDRWWSQDMVLTSITEVPNIGEPVPEPTTIFLFGLGLLGIAGVNGRKR